MTIVLGDFLLDHTRWEDLKNILINPTGLIRTDLLILDIFGKSILEKISKNKWENILSIIMFQKNSLKSKKIFLKTRFWFKSNRAIFRIKKEDIENNRLSSMEVAGVSREWYPFYLG